MKKQLQERKSRERTDREKPGPTVGLRKQGSKEREQGFKKVREHKVLDA